LQQQRDRAERQWLQTNTVQSTVHHVELAPVRNATKGDGSLYSSRYASTRLSGHLDSAAIDELSGLAPFRGSKNSYWAINDSGNPSELFVATESGQLKATIALPVINRDWEDLASFSSNGKNWLVVADTGDNLRRRTTSTLYFFIQPDASNLPESLKLHHRVDFNYAEGPKNVESMAVSISEQKIFLIAKENGRASIYSLPLLLEQPGDVLTAQADGSLFETFSTRDTKWWERTFAKRFLLAPTALDISADDRLAVVANYRHAYLFRRASGESWTTAFSKKPQVLLTHRMEQSEAVAFSPDSKQVIISSEGLNAPVLLVSPAVNQN